MALRILIALLILAVPMELPGCGPFLPEAIFHLKTAPESPADFARGRLGILQPSYERLYQVIAYRYLAGIGLNDGEQRAILPPEAKPEPDFAPAPTVTPNPWLEARNRVPGVTPIRQIDPYRNIQQPGYFTTYLNCNDDAFRTAAATLKRVQQAGKPLPWIAAQDVVFADCSDGAAVPPSEPDPDRAYQIASARFYTQQYDAARQDFQTIAADASSPWREIAPYLAARCLIRAGKFAEAETDLQRIAADPAQQRWHASAISLIGYVELRLHPAQRMHELAVGLLKPNSQATIGQDLIDYRQLFDQNVKPEGTDDLSQWIASFQLGGQGALAKWRANRSLPWLVAALSSVGPKDADVPELLAAASAVKPDSPAYLTVNYRRVLLSTPDDARAVADAILAGNIPPAVRNQFRAERLRLARDFDEFVKFAARQPVARLTDAMDPVTEPESFLDEDAADAFDRTLPLSLLKQASTSKLLPESIRKDLRTAARVRALLLSPAPPFADVLALLKTPADRPFVASGYGRFTKEAEKIDPYRDNWWCAPGIDPQRGNVFLPPLPGLPFLTEAQRSEATAEQDKLKAAGGAPDWMGQQVLAFAAKNPQDPRVPEALYLVVHATRYGCTDSRTGDFSKQAFDLLHRRYPDTEWARKTPFWFK